MRIIRLGTDSPRIHSITDSNGLEWRDIPGYEGLYRVSRAGRIWSVPRVVSTSHGRYRPIEGRILKPLVTRQGYLRVALSKNGRRAHLFVHRLVALAFLGEPPAGTVVCHNDGNPQNNHVANLRWDTQSNNQLDAVYHGTHAKSRRKVCPRGHILQLPNLRYRYSSKRRPYKECLACDRASSYVRLHPELDLALTSDVYYREIMEKVAA